MEIEETIQMLKTASIATEYMKKQERSLKQKEQKLKEIEGLIDSDLTYCMQGWQIIKEIKKILKGKDGNKNS